MIERVATFGAENCLTGIVTEPMAADEGAPAILLLTAGIVHHVGPFRLYVDLARLFSDEGYLVLRFDVSGVGDSQLRPDKLPEAEVPCADIREAMDYLTRRYCKSRYILLGLCSGAYQAHDVAVLDPRVVGVAMLDGYGYRTIGYFLYHFTSKYLSPARFAKFIRRKRRQLTTGSWSMRPEDPRLEIYAEDFPPRERIRSEIHELANRGVQMLFIYSGGVPEYFNHLGQFESMFGKLPRQQVDVEYFDHADHTYSWGEDRQQLIERIVAWVRCRFPLKPSDESLQPIAINAASIQEPVEQFNRE